MSKSTKLMYVCVANWRKSLEADHQNVFSRLSMLKCAFIQHVYIKTCISVYTLIYTWQAHTCARTRAQTHTHNFWRGAGLQKLWNTSYIIENNCFNISLFRKKWILMYITNIIVIIKNLVHLVLNNLYFWMY